MSKEIEKAVRDFQSIAFPDHRYSSFDYCYNYFYKVDSKKISKDIEKSCAFLGFYLASWGMFRGSSFLLQKSYRYFVPLVTYISKLDKDVWEMKPDSFLEEMPRRQVIEIYNSIKNLIIEDENQSKTLVTKIMLGTLGIVPAYDEYFCKTFKNIDPELSKFSTFGVESLQVIGQFYQRNKQTIDELSNKTWTKKFDDDSDFLNYPPAKIIDMYGFVKGTRQ